MGDLLGLIVVISVIVSALSSKAEKKRKAAQKKAPAMPMEAFGGSPQADAAETREPIIHLYDPAKDVPNQQLPHAAKQIAKPRVEPKVHVTPHLPDMFAGSLNAVTHEGEDPCHDELLTHAAQEARMAPVPEEKPGLTLEWTGDAMVKAFVMQEVLTRPCDRRRRI